MKKKLKLVTAIVAVIVVAGTVFYACKKDMDNSMLKSHKSFSSNMRTFASMEELFVEVEKVISMDVQEIENYEKTIGFCSFGRMTNDIYYPIVEPIVENELDFSIDQAREYVMQYPKYLEIITDEDGEYEFVQKYRCELFRYIMNEDRLFQVDENIYKVFNEVVISTTVEKAGILSAITEESIDRIIQEIDNGQNTEITVSCSRITKSTDDDDTTKDKPDARGGTRIITTPPNGPTPGPCGRQYGTYGRYEIYRESPVASNNQEKVIGRFRCDSWENPADFQCITSVFIYAKWRGKCKHCIWVGCWRTLNMDFNIEIWHENTRYSIHHQDKTSKPKYDYGLTLFNKMGAYDKGKVFRSSIYNLCGRFWIATTERVLDE